MSTLPVYVNYTACQHGIDASVVQLRRDEVHDALYIELGGDNVSVRIDLKDKSTLGRDRDGLLRLAETAAQAAQEAGQLLEEDQAEGET